MFEEIESSTILRVMPSINQQFSEHIQRGDSVSVHLLPHTDKAKARLCTVHLGSTTFHGLLFDLPRHVETYKTLDKEQYTKTNDVAQMLVVFDDPQELEKYKDNVYYPHGLSKPLRNAYNTLMASIKSLQLETPEDVAAIESYICNEERKKFEYGDVVAEQHCAKSTPSTTVYI